MTRRRSTRARSAPSLTVAVAVALAGLTPALAAPPPRITVVVVGDPGLRAEAQAHLARRGARSFALELVEAPNQADTGVETATAGVTARLAAARRHYVDGAFRRCLAEVPDEATGRRLLGEGQRQLAARALLWRIACHVAADQPGQAASLAGAFASYGLDLPSDVAAVSPDIEALLSAALGRRERAAKVRLTIRSRPSGARVMVDGVDRGCTTPCPVSLPAGDHLVKLEADGHVSEARVVAVGRSDDAAELALRPAAPAEAARQWSSRYRATPLEDSTPSVMLLSRAVRARRVVLVSARPHARGVMLRGTLVLDGRPAAQGARVAPSGVLADQVDGLLRDLLVSSRILEPATPLTRRPMFWVAVGSALAAGVASAVWYQSRPVRTEIGFGGP